MTDERIWAYCPKCKHTQRFVRVETPHRFHAVMTVFTCGLWAISWAAIAVGHRIWPWRCKHCNSSDPDLTKKRQRIRKDPETKSVVSPTPGA